MQGFTCHTLENKTTTNGIYLFWSISISSNKEVLGKDTNMNKCTCNIPANLIDKKNLHSEFTTSNNYMFQYMSL